MIKVLIKILAPKFELINLVIINVYISLKNFTGKVLLAHIDAELAVLTSRRPLENL